MRLLYKTGPMESLRKWFYKPRRDDRSLLAQFFFADDALNMIAAELDSFDGRKDPERCSTLVNQLRHAQDRVLNITSQIMDQVLGDERVARGFRVKFPEDVLQDNLAGQLWFGAECLAAGSSIMNREEESAAMRPLAKALTRSLETVRSLLREQCLRPRGLALQDHDDMLHESLRIFDRLFAEFELCYVSAMVNVKTPHEFEAQQLICVLFSESLRRALKQNLLTQEQVDSYDPALMFAVPRLAIVSGLLIYSSGPLSIDKMPEEMSDMFRPFRTLLHKIRSLLWTLDRRELLALERFLCTNEDVSNLAGFEIPPDDSTQDSCYPDIGEFVSKFYADHAHCRDLYTTQSSSEPTITDGDYLPDNIEVMTPIIDGLKRLSEDVDESERESEQDDRHTDTASTDTFQTNESKDFDRTRKISRPESDLSSLRNLSTNGLMMFDPLVINAVSASTSSSEPRQIPDQELVTSLNELVDRLSSFVTEVDTILDMNKSHSFSTNDVPTLISNDSSEDFGFTGPRNEQLSCMPSTSHGYLIPNAISQEPVVLASLSHNNSAVFNQDEDGDFNRGLLNPDVQLMIPSIDADIVNMDMTIASVNLSQLLITKEELKENCDNIEMGDPSFANVDIDKGERVKFMLGYESDHDSPADSGVSTENTSLDRSPDTEQNKNIKENHFMQQNRVLKSPVDEIDEKETKNTLESSFSDVRENVVNIVEEHTQKNEAGSSHIDSLNIDGLNEATSINSGSVQNWGSADAQEEFRTIEDVITELRRHRESDKKISSLVEDNNRSNEPNCSSSNSRRKTKKTSMKSKKKKKLWSPVGHVILDNRTTQKQNSPLRLNLDHFVDESGTSCDSAECADDEQIALALQAQELAARQQARGKFKSSEDLIHRLFVCIAGVADQLQTNFAADLRNILKAVFQMNQTCELPETKEEETIVYQPSEDQVIQTGSSFDSVYSAEEVYADSNSDSTASESNPRLTRRNTVNATTIVEQATPGDTRRKSVDNSGNLQASVSTGDLTYSREERSQPASVERAPEWVPDIAAPACMRCSAHFTAFRRRHHCRNCGKVFCASCSSNSIPLPRYGQMKPVRVCEECFQTIAQNCRRQTSHYR
ncbi:lateral signaling target protein 2 homolog isoform X2 [Maniola jurtina]|uniref:lateral signaling target protein 2 homolog isoform X2 n=1 Tax=Maniola jurtina TaxID=191418 RepID=UPI001E68CA8C|nr:lateral signaling target protein 2 homolog isoform X2 [Maniola jurtina]